MHTRHFLPLLLVLLLACNETREPAQPSPDTVAADTAAQGSEPLVLRREGPVSAAEAFEVAVYNEFAHAATAVPRRVTDSLFRLHKRNPRKLEAEMSAYLKRLDDQTRERLAGKYNITVDSVNAILKKKNQED